MSDLLPGVAGWVRSIITSLAILTELEALNGRERQPSGLQSEISSSGPSSGSIQERYFGPCWESRAVVLFFPSFAFDVGIEACRRRTRTYTRVDTHASTSVGTSFYPHLVQLAPIFLQ